jgi:D-alanine-D-alanine ligase
MMARLRLGLIFGGRSVEHEVSVVSALHVMAAADSERFEIVPLGVAKSGAWLTPQESMAQMARDDPPFKKTLTEPEEPQPDFRVQMLREAALEGSGFRTSRQAPSAGDLGLGRVLEALRSVDVVFPLVHGTHGEDGTLQGLLELLDLPYVGCGVAASAIGMDKTLMKTVFLGAGIPVAEHLVIEALSEESGALAVAREIEERLGYPAFVKPANGGSSVGISKVRSREELTSGILVASGHDRKLVIEKGIDGVEVECAILGNQDAQASPVGMIRYARDFYDYEAKYLDPATEILAPADLPTETVENVQRLALRAYQSLDGAGMSRVDFFLLADGSLIIDEINTIPGFTPASMFPRLWQAAGVSYSELITRLVDLALARHKEKRIA